MRSLSIVKMIGRGFLNSVSVLHTKTDDKYLFVYHMSFTGHTGQEQVEVSLLS